MKKVIILSILYFAVFTLQGQISTSVIIRTNNDFESANVHYQELSDNSISIREISKSQNLSIIESNNHLDLSKILKIEGVENAWYDSKLSNRAVPNDMLYDQQWAITLSKIDKVWDFTTGGTSEDGREIVIAVLDDGFNMEHEDLSDAFYTNTAEIPNNGKDDDDNGYIDDFKGLNISTGNDMHPSLTHGTSVTGLIGANSNNGIGISGVNWNIKILPISGVNTVGKIIESYEYILDLRKKYNASNGAEGAYVVVTSYSGGVDDEFPVGIYKDWCDLYDNLGQEGVLNFGATTNRFVNVDETGDMPSTCTSDYFVGITSLARGGEVDMGSGYGAQSIDLAAPGNNIITTQLNDEYGGFDGTSAATPMASGAAALLFAAPCSSLSKLVESSPAEAAKFIKKIMVEGVTISSEMANLYVSGGYLDAFRALKKMVDLCDGDLLIPNEPGALRITDALIVDQELEVYYVAPNDQSHFVRLSDPLGRQIEYQEFIPQEFGERVVRIPINDRLLGTIYLSIGNKKTTTTKGYFFRQ